MFMHYSIILIIFKDKKIKFPQEYYDNLFDQIENNLRESGLGDVAVNQKMKILNKILYDILLKIKKSENEFIINKESHLIFIVTFSLSTIVIMAP